MKGFHLSRLAQLRLVSVQAMPISKDKKNFAFLSQPGYSKFLWLRFGCAFLLRIPVCLLILLPVHRWLVIDLNLVHVEPMAETRSFRDGSFFAIVCSSQSMEVPCHADVTGGFTKLPAVTLQVSAAQHPTLGERMRR